MNTDALILSCEHASGDVPVSYRHLFASASGRRALDSHRGVDFGAVALARAFQRAFRCPLFEASVTRLLVDTNRSPHHVRLFSEFSRSLAPAERALVLGTYYYPHRLRVKRAVESAIESGRRAVHVSVHSFTPRLAGHERTADIGILYDPARSAEVALAARWRTGLRQAAPAYRVRRNYPYRGADDGATTWLRSEFSARSYVGIELEVNQRFFLHRGRPMQSAVVSALIAVLTSTLPLRSAVERYRRPGSRAGALAR